MTETRTVKEYQVELERSPSALVVTAFHPIHLISVSIEGAWNAAAEQLTLTAVAHLDFMRSRIAAAVPLTAQSTTVPSVSIVSSASAAEGNAGPSLLPFAISLSQVSTQAVTVTVNSANGTATGGGTTGGSDFVAISGLVVTVPIGQTSATVNVSINGDTTFEPDETFTLILSSPTNATLGVAQATGTITNDDSATGGGGTPSGGVTRDASGNFIGTSGADRIDAATPAVTTGPDTIFGAGGNDTIFGGNSGAVIATADFLIGDDGDDQLFGEEGVDALFGRTGNDTLNGGADTDLIFAEEGNDRIIGGTGQDALVGGTGADVFVLTADATNQNLEGVFDFNRAEGDKFEYSAAAFGNVTAAAVVAGQFNVQGFVLSGGALIPTVYTAVNLGRASALQILLVGGNPTLIASDFNVGA